MKRRRGFAVSASGYRFLSHTTDAYIEATGYTFEQALEVAGTALFDTMCEVKSITPILSDNVNVSGDDDVSLLQNWLESLLLKFELDSKVYSQFRVAQIEKFQGTVRTNAKISGEPYDRRKHGSKVEVKAVTYHKMEVLSENKMTTVRFILDL